MYLFREDFTGAYLSLNQGVTEVKTRYHTGAKHALIARGTDFRARLGGIPGGFSSADIDLRPSSSSNNSAFYEAGNICSVFYDTADLPNEERFVSDLVAILQSYAAISDADPDLSSAAVEGDEPPTGDEFDEDHRRFKAHRRLERNPTVSKRVKAAQQLRLPCLRIRLSYRLSRSFSNKIIEAHHLVPISQLKGQKVRRDPIKDFAVLCSNCHRMIHRTAAPDDLEAFKRTLKSE